MTEKLKGNLYVGPVNLTQLYHCILDGEIILKEVVTSIIIYDMNFRLSADNNEFDIR